MSRPSWKQRLLAWEPRWPAVPADLADQVGEDDPAWFARELAVAATPPWWFWRFLLHTVSPAVPLFGRLQITGSVSRELLDGPLILAANHIGDYDSFVMGASLHSLGITPRFMAAKGIITAPLVGPVLERSGGIRVDRGTDVAARALRVVEEALARGGHVALFPEGRVGLTPDGWPEKGRTGLARLALGTRVPVLPISQWGAHEVLAYGNDRTKLRTAASALWRQPALKVHVGPPVPLDDLELSRVGDANKARTRINAAITRGLAPLRAHEPADRILFHDPTRPVRATAAFPGGVVPDDVPGASEPAAGPERSAADTLRR